MKTFYVRGRRGKGGSLPSRIPPSPVGHLVRRRRLTNADRFTAPDIPSISNRFPAPGYPPISRIIRRAAPPSSFTLAVHLTRHAHVPPTHLPYTTHPEPNNHPHTRHPHPPARTRHLPLARMPPHPHHKQKHLPSPPHHNHIPHKKKPAPTHTTHTH